MTSSQQTQATASVLVPLPVRDLSIWVDPALPASLRAEFAWAPTALRRELQPLIEGPLETSVVEKAARCVLEIQARMLPAITHGLSDLSGHLDDAYEAELGRLRSILPDGGSKRSGQSGSYVSSSGKQWPRSRSDTLRN